MQTQTALVGADRGVELDAPAAVDLHLTGVVYPRNAEIDDALGLNDALHDAVGLDLGTCHNDRLEGLEDFLDGLQEFRLVRVALRQTLIYSVQVFALKHLFRPPENFVELKR